MSLPFTYYAINIWLKNKKVKGPLRIQNNGREMYVHYKEKITGYNRRAWFSRRDITNIIDLKN